MIYRYEIPDIPPSNNQFIGRDNKWRYQQVKKYWSETIAVFCYPRPKQPLEKVVITITYHFKDKRKRDPDNYSGKMILDGLKTAGIIIDDNFDVITLVLRKGEADKLRPRTIIEVEEITEKKGNQNAQNT